MGFNLNSIIYKIAQKHKELKMKLVVKDFSTLNSVSMLMVYIVMNNFFNIKNAGADKMPDNSVAFERNRE